MIVTPELRRHFNRILELHPGYRECLASMGIDPLAARFSELPLLTAERLDSIYYKQAPRTEAGLDVYYTSGTSSGIRKAIYYSQEDETHYLAAKMSCFQSFLASGARQRQISKAFADVGTGHAASTAAVIFRKLGIHTETISFSEPIERHIARLQAFKPELLYTMPSILEAIARAAGSPESLGISRIILVGEPAPPAWQSRMAARFGIGTDDILDTYGSIEVGAIASYSQKHGVYLFADGLYAETVSAEQLDPRFGTLRDNEGVLALTSWTRSMFPVIRYVTYDVVRDFQVIEIDGRPRQTFSCISNRIGAELKHGEKISLYDIENVVHAIVSDAELRVSVRDNKLSVRIRSKALDDDRLLDAVRHAIEHKIDAIGQMIDGGMLERIEVIRAGEHEALEQGPVKSKKIYN